MQRADANTSVESPFAHGGLGLRSNLSHSITWSGMYGTVSSAGGMLQLQATATRHETSLYLPVRPSTFFLNFPVLKEKTHSPVKR